jgi:hypothetical protein
VKREAKTVWTPKRVLLLALGFALLFSSYLVYAHYLGGIDGLPPLPEIDRPSPEPMDPPQYHPNWVDERLEMAFGPGCPELKRDDRLEVHEKGIVLSTDHFHAITIGEDRDRAGQVKIQPLSLALFNKKTPPGQYPEITTVRAKMAYLTFDRPISNMGDIAKAKVIGAELQDDIEIVNNRGKPRSSNVEVYVEIKNGKAFYSQRPPPAPGEPRQPDIWTEKRPLRLTDYQSKPKPTIISAEGMDLYLTSEAASQQQKATPAPRKTQKETISGVERIYLRSNVRMDMYTEANSGFLSSGPKQPAARPSTKPAPGQDVTQEKNPVIIQTAGSFDYDLQTDLAVFEVPKTPSSLSPYEVKVTRVPKPGVYDQLVCDRLEIRFHRKSKETSKPGASPEDRTADLEMETAHATGKEVVLSSDAETLSVSNANELHYDARNRTTIVRGDGEIMVLKEAHELYARQLIIQDTSAGQQMTAAGPGRMGLFDKATRKRSVTAAWKDTLTSSKDGSVDLLTLSGDANFQDEEHQQSLNADEIKVWLEPSGEVKTAAASASAQNSGSRRPQRVEATRNVLSRSPEMYIHDTDKLILVFKDAPPAAPPKGSPASSNPASPAGRPEPSAPSKPGVKSEPAKPARPIDLSATRVEARVLRLEGGKNELDRLWTEGDVKVHQAPEKPDEKGLDIKGDTLELIKQPDGNRVIVTGDVAELQVDKLVIRGPQIEVDQAVNEAWVKGVGALTMRNKTSFNGTPLDHEVDMTIYWTQYMHFQGAHADFTGSIQAEQENARLACQKSLQVDLDKPISFREGQKNGPPAKVDRMVCDMKVIVKDEEFKDGKYVKSTQIECTTLTVDNTEGRAYGSGPGRVRIHQRGDAGSPLAPTASAQPGRATTASKQKEEEFKLTIVKFGGRMWADDKTHTAVFSDDIKVINLATDNPDLEPDENRLPRDAVYLQCSQKLDVRNRSENGKSNQELEGIGNVLCRTAAYLGQCEKLNYIEAMDKLIFDGLDGLAHLKKLEAPGTVGQTWDAKRIIYNRKIDSVKSEGARGINGVTGP